MTTQTGDLKDLSDVRKVFDRWLAAIRALDVDGVAEGHPSDIVMFDVAMPPQFKGLSAYREIWDNFFQWFGPDGVFEPSELSITAGKDVAFLHCLVRCEGSTGPNTLPIRLTLCFRKVDGAWLIVHEHHSAPYDIEDADDGDDVDA